MYTILCVCACACACVCVCVHLLKRCLGNLVQEHLSQAVFFKKEKLIVCKNLLTTITSTTNTHFCSSNHTTWTNANGTIHWKVETLEVKGETIDLGRDSGLIHISFCVMCSTGKMQISPSQSCNTSHIFANVVETLNHRTVCMTHRASTHNWRRHSLTMTGPYK